MLSAEALLALTRHPRLAPHAFGSKPAWLWRADGRRVVWCNAAGAALFRAATPADFARHEFGPDHPVAMEVRRLAESLPQSGGVQLARLRAFPSGLAGNLTCSTCRLDVAARESDGAGILIVGAEPARPVLPLAERARRMFADDPRAVLFASDGKFLYAAPQMMPYLAGRTSLAALAVAGLANEARDDNRAVGESAMGPVALERLGGGAAVVLYAAFQQGPEAANAEVPPLRAEDSGERDVRGAIDDAEARLVERGHPLRFVWRMDAAGRFSIDEGDFTLLAGGPTTTLMGAPWSEVSAALALDPRARVAQAIASRDTFSGIAVEWPIEGGGSVPVILSGLPVFAADRSFDGHRGFGVCRDIARLTAAFAARRDAQAAMPEDIPISGAAPTAPHAQKIELRPHLTLVPVAKNVVPLRAVDPAARRPVLTPVERDAFREIARVLGARLDFGDGPPEEPSAAAPAESAAPHKPDVLRQTEELAAALRVQMAAGAEQPPAHEPAPPLPLERAVLDKMPLAALAYRGDDLLLANRAFFEWTGYRDLAALAAAGGLPALFTEPAPSDPDAAGTMPRALRLRIADGTALPVDVRLLSLPSSRALMLLLAKRADSDRATAPALADAQARARELKSILDTATDGVIVVDSEGRILAGNLSAEALFGYEDEELTQRSLFELFAPESQREAFDYFGKLTRGGIAGLLNDGREVIGRVRQGGLIPLFMTMGRVADAPPRYCAVFRDLTQWKRNEEELVAARREAARAASAKSDILGKISHELRTPLNTIIGFAELMAQERLGPIGDERYRAYLKDILACGTQVVALLDDLLDLSRIEAGRLELSFVKLDLNDLMQQCVASMQAQANRERIIIRTALSPAMPPVMGDARSLRQIVLNLLSNSIKFTGAGGQVIVSTAVTDTGEAVLRVRDTGIGMSEQQIEHALRPFAPLQANPPPLPSGAGVGLPLARALAEANRASFQIKSAVNAGTLAEVIFPASRVLAK